MKNTLKKTLSLLLALTMVLSLGLPAYAVGVPEDDIAIAEEPAVKPANLPIGAGKQPGVIEEDEIISEDLIVDIVDAEGVVEEDAAPARTFTYSEAATGFAIEVSAPAGALPLGTEMVVDRLIDLATVQAAVDAAENLEGEVQLAADISFWLNGEEIEPAEGAKLFVRMSAPEIEGIADPVVIHLPDGENAVPEIVEQMSADDDLVLVNTVEFEATDFSVYAVIGEVIIEDEEGSIELESDAYYVTVSYTKEAEIPVGTKLTVSEIPYGSDEYWDLKAAAQEKLNEEAFLASAEPDPAELRGIAEAIFVDVSLEYNGKPLEPTVPLDVKIILKDGALYCPADEEAVVVHFGADGTELIEDVACGLAPYALPEGMADGALLNSFGYEQTGFSSVGLVTTDVYIDFEHAEPISAIPNAADLMAGLVKAEGDPTINAGKTVEDSNGDGVYELALSINATSQQSSTAEVVKSNVVMVIDASRSMTYNNVYSEYTYSADTYNSSSTYRDSASNQGTRVYYGTVTINGSSYTGWYSRRGGNNYTAYSGTVYVYETRLDATKRAACAVVDALLAYNVNDDNITDIFEITVIQFSNRADTKVITTAGGTAIQKSTNATDIKAAIDRIATSSGTHWRAALEEALTQANYFKTQDGAEEKTSVIFLTDGMPTYWGAAGAEQQGIENNNDVPSAFLDSLASGRAIVSGGYTLYGIFAFGSDTTTYGNDSVGGAHTGFEYLRGLTNYAYGSGTTVDYTETAITRQYCFNAKSTADLVAAFSTIVNHITNNVGFAGVSLSDGVSLGATSTSVAVNGTAKPELMRYTVTDDRGRLAYTVKFSGTTATFTIYNEDGTTTTLTDNSVETVTTPIGSTDIESQIAVVTDDNGKEYMMAPATIDGDTGMVKWNLAALGILESGYTYTLEFDVWPNQLTYDIAADLNNGFYDGDIDEALKAYGVTDEAEREQIKEAIVKNADGSYSIKTNYSQSIEYYPATEVTDDNGTHWEYGGAVNKDLREPDPVPLKGSSLPLKKVWESNLSPAELNELLWEDGIVNGTSNEYQITLYVWKADDEEALMAQVEEGDVSKAYITETLGWDAELEDYVWQKAAAVAPGMMVNLEEAANLGYDTSIAANVRIFGEKEYYVVELGHYYYVTESGSDLHFELESPLYHPMIVDGTLYNVFFGPNQTVIKMDPMYAVTATNFLKGGLNISKIVTDFEGNEIEGVEDEFAFKITLWKEVEVEDDEGNVTTTIEPVYTYDDQFGVKDKTTGEINYTKAISGSIGYREFGLKADGSFETLGRNVIIFEDTDNAEAKHTANKKGVNVPVYATMTDDNKTEIILRMPANGEIRIVNLPRDTKYTVEEILDTSEDAVYTYVQTDSYLKYTVDEDEEVPGEGEEPVEPVEPGDPEVPEEPGEGEEGEETGPQEKVDHLGTNTDNLGQGTISGNKANVEVFTNKTGAYFYVYHSADNTVERISFADNRVKGEFDSESNKYSYSFNLAEETKTGYIYGGYYDGYGKMGADFDALNAAYTEAEAAVATAYVAVDKRDKGFWAEDEDGEPYEGDISFWTGTAYTENGLEREVKADDIYFLKEVPDAYLRGVIRYTYYDNAEKTIGSVVFASAIDEQYSTYGIIKLDGDDQGDVEGASTALLTIKPVNAKDASSTLSVDPVNILGKITWNGKKLTDNKGFVGYNRVYDKHIDEVDENGNVVVEHEASRCVADDQLTTMFWVTADGVRVTGVRNIKVSNIGGSALSTASNYIKLNYPKENGAEVTVASTLAVYVEPTTEP